MKKLLYIVLLALAAVALPSSTYAGDNQPAKRFTAELSGANEVPPVASMASGQATLHVIRNGSAIRYRLELSDIDQVIVAHIHLIKTGNTGPFVVFLYGPVNPPVSGDVEVTGEFTAANFVGDLRGRPMSELLDAMRSGRAYVNAHTTAHPGGEIRGTVVVEDEDDE